MSSVTVAASPASCRREPPRLGVNALGLLQTVAPSIAAISPTAGCTRSTVRPADLTLDPARRLAHRGKRLLELNPKESAVLEQLLIAD